MTNYEHYKKEIEKITRLGLDFAFDKSSNRIILCNGFSCSKCLFNSANLIDCDERKIKWADEEYKGLEPEVDWSKVAVDTKVLVSDDGKHWFNKHFAGVDHIGKPLIWCGGVTSWSTYKKDNYTTPNYIKLAEGDDNEK